MKTLKDKFVEKANKIHNGFYNYENAIYFNSLNKIEINCPLHGVFLQRPDNHLRGSGCNKCVGLKPLNTDEFIEKANKIHNGFYNYKNTIYVNSSSKVEVICPLHGAFKQAPNNHLQGSGCNKCNKVKKTITTDEFMEKANKIHKNFYDYKNTIYLNALIKVEIVCPLHGAFKQTPNNHLQGSGCPICKETKGEKIIRSYLKLNNIDFKQEHTVKLKDCWFRFDFVVMKNNLPMVIEFNGIQHYVPNNFGSKKDNAAFDKLFDNIKRDFLKYKKCKENNIPLLVIPYWDIKRISEILNNFLSGVEPEFSKPPKIVKEYEKQYKLILENLESYLNK